MRMHSRILVAVALLAAPALVACDKGDSGETEAQDPEEGSTAGADSEGADTEDAITEEPGAVCDAEHFEAARACAGGTQFCVTVGERYGWGVCVAKPMCVPGELADDGCSECDLSAKGVPYLDDTWCGSNDPDEDTPLVLSFEGEAVRYGSAGYRFEVGPRCAATDWPTAATPWLALDRDRSGAIEGGHELFGSATRLRGGELAENGFLALQELDSDGDGRLTAADPGFAALVLWSDHDGDRRSSGLELQPLAAFGLVAIELGYASDRRCDLRGNCEVERASFTYVDALGRGRAGEVVDVHLGCQ